MDNVLEGALKTGNIAGAYLIEGSFGYVQAETDAFIGKLFCESGAGCGTCSGCRKIKAGFHPDLLKITPSGQSIKVEDVEELGEWIARKPFEGGYKAIVIHNAGLMVEAVQNKLLKAMEEPPDRTVFLLGADNRKNILPTVLSRCIIIRMHSGGRDAVVGELKKRFELSTMSAAVLARTVNFDPYAAAELVRRNYPETREDCLRAAKRLLEAKNRAISMILDLLLKHAENLDDVFLALECFLRDILIYKNTNSDGLIRNTDKIIDIKAYAARLSNSKLTRVLQILQQTDEKRKICLGLIKKLLLENMLFEILEVLLT
jgi:DNA polymerase-3 subunit delta'